MPFADTHCHLDLEVFDADREAVIRRASRAGVTRMLIPSVDRSSIARILVIAQRYPQIYAGIGVHPTEVDAMAPDDLDTIMLRADDAKIVAIGEIGLDYYWVKDPAARARQRATLRAQLDMARRTKRPVIVHLREQGDAESGHCATDLLALLGEWVTELTSTDAPLARRPGVLHSFSGSLETAQRAIELGFYIGVTGPVTFRNAERRREIIAALPLDRLLVETDAPFLAPQAHRGQRNEPAFVVDIADRIADVQSRTPREVADATSANAARLFAWGDTT